MTDNYDNFAANLSFSRYEIDPDLPEDKQDEQIIENLMGVIVHQCDYHISGKSGMWDEPYEGMSVKTHEFEPALTLRQPRGSSIGPWSTSRARCSKSCAIGHSSGCCRPSKS
jgi:hypothetical protein